LQLEDFHTAATSGTVSAICDDGCIGYLNDVELFRMNMPAGIATADSLAPAVGNETTYTTTTVSLPSGRLRVGTNTLAVEVHNNATTSSDLGFDMTFSLDVIPPPIDVPHRLGLRAIAARGDPAVGLPANFQLASPSGGNPFFGVALSNSGQTVFNSLVSGPGTNPAVDMTIWLGRRHNLQLLARARTPTPGVTALDFRELGNAWLNNRDDVAFYATVGPIGELVSFDSIWTTVGDEFRPVAYVGQQAPGTPAGVRFAVSPSYRMREFKFSDGGQIAFIAALEGPGVNGNNEYGVWIENDGILSLAARRSSSVPPGLPSGTIWNSISLPVMNSHGDYILSGQVINSSSVRSSHAWLRSGSQSQLLPTSGGAAPGYANGWTFTGISYPFLDNDGRFFARADVQNGANTSGGLWFGTPGSLQRLVYDNMPVPELGVGVQLEDPFEGAGSHYNQNGEVTSLGSLRQVGILGITAANDGVLWVYRDGAVHIVAREGQPAPGLPEGTHFIRLTSEQPLINDHGQVAFFAELVRADNSAAGTAAFAEDRDGVLHLLAYEGDTFETGPGQSHVITSIVPTPRFSDYERDGYRPAWNDNGQLAFLAYLGSNQGAVLISDQLLVPEPSGVLMFALAFAASMWRRRTVRRRSR
jgi:hypothetical protein